MASVDPKTQVLKARTRETESRGWFGRFLVVLVFVAAVAGGGYWYFFAAPGSMERLTDKVLSTVDTSKNNAVTLYFADPQWTKLVPEGATMANEPDKGKKIARLVELLARGPAGDAGPVLPRTARVRQVFLGANGLAIVDLEPGFEELGRQGAGAELLTVFSLVQTITENVEGVASVRLLIGGRDVETLAGNVSIIEPLRPRPELAGAVK